MAFLPYLMSALQFFALMFMFISWGLGFFMARLGGSIKDWTGTLDWALYISVMVLIAAVLLSWVTKQPMLEHENA
jgi:OFA family oxalate/formate antiporter-like MFS transporter